MRSVLLAAALLLFGSAAHAQQPAKPDTAAQRRAQQQTAQMVDMMGPMMQQVAVSTLEGTLTAMAKPENAALLADFTRNFYDALIKRGFTPEQALQIVIGIGLPRAAAPAR